MKLPPIHTWTEPVDAMCIAGVASCFVVRSGWVYGASVFILVDVAKFQRQDWPTYYDESMKKRAAYSEAKRRAKDLATELFKARVVSEHGGRLPAIERLRNMTGGVGIDLTW